MNLISKAFLSLAVAAAWQSVVAAPSTQPVATVNGVAIPATRMDLILKEAAKNGETPTPSAKEQIREKLIGRQVLLLEAHRRGLDKAEEVNLRSKLAVEDVVISALITDVVQKNPASEIEVKVAYDEFASGFSGNEYRINHVLLANEADAKRALERVKAGEKIEDVAQSSSIDPSSASRGGDLGWAREAAFGPELSVVLQTMSQGQTYPAAIKSKFGWHIIRLNEARASKVPAFDQVEAQLRQVVVQRKVLKLQKELRDSAIVQ